MFKVSEKVGSKYRFVRLCAQRARQILQGAEIRVETTATKPAAVAMQEMLADKVFWHTIDTQPPPVPDTTQTIEVEAGA